jgi:hypothetical protein
MTIDGCCDCGMGKWYSNVRRKQKRFLRWPRAKAARGDSGMGYCRASMANQLANGSLLICILDPESLIRVGKDGGVEERAFPIRQRAASSEWHDLIE